MQGLYFHIPFCVQKCHYCDFTSYTCTDEQDNYTQGILREIELQKEILKQQEWSTIFFGGGTPSLLSTTNFKKITTKLGQFIDMTNIKEFTLEVNPKTVSEEKFKEYKKVGVNRLSVGVQSFNKKELSAIGRIHTPQNAINTIKMAQKNGFNNISLDLIYGLPYQTLDALVNNIKIASSLNVSHISLYGLQVEEDTPLESMVLEKKFTLPTDEEMAQMYLMAVKCLEEQGFKQYEISNFAKDKLVSLHNLIYWTYGDYLGFGVSSHSKIANKRFSNIHDLKKYINKLNSKTLPLSTKETLSTEDMEFEKNMLSLRITKGAHLSTLRDKDKAFELVENGYGIISNDRLRLTPKGFLISNEIINKLL